MPQFLVHPADVDEAAAGAVLRGAEAHHLATVNRARVGDPVALFDGRGRRWKGRVARLGRGEVGVAELLPADPHESPLAVDLLVCLPKGDRWEWVVAKATELGVSSLRPLYAEHSVVQLPPARLEGRLEKWRQWLLAAAKQSERGRLPELHAPAPVADLAALLGPQPADEVRLVLAERGTGPAQPAAQPTRVRVAVGPEGGWSAADRAQLAAAGFTPFTAGPRILRTETAALLGAALVQAWWGDLVAAPHR